MSKTLHALVIYFGFLVLVVAVLNLAGITNARWLVSGGTLLLIIYGSLRIRGSERAADRFSLRRRALFPR